MCFFHRALHVQLSGSMKGGVGLPQLHVIPKANAVSSLRLNNCSKSRIEGPSFLTSSVSGSGLFARDDFHSQRSANAGASPCFVLFEFFCCASGAAKPHQAWNVVRGEEPVRVAG